MSEGRIWAALGAAFVLALALPVWVMVRGAHDAAPAPARAVVVEPVPVEAPEVVEARPAPKTLRADITLDGEIDPETHLVRSAGYALAVAHCTGCHSGKLVAQNRGDRAHWRGLFRWMQATQKLWSFPPDVEERLLDYLVASYGPKDTGRRPPLPAHLLPPERALPADDPAVVRAQAALAPRRGELCGAAGAADVEGVRVGRATPGQTWIDPALRAFASGAQPAYVTAHLPGGVVGYAEPVTPACVLFAEVAR